MSSRKLLFNIARRYPLHILANIGLGFSGALFNGVSTALIVPILLSLLGQDAVLKNGPPVIQHLLRPFGHLEGDTRLYVMAVVVLLVIILKNLTAYLNSLSSSALNRALTSDLQEEGLKVLFEVDLGFYAKTRAGDLLNTVGGEMVRACSTITASISLFATSITIFVFAGLLLSISWQLTLITVFLLPISSFGNHYWIVRAKKYGKLISDLSKDYASSVVEVLNGIRLIKATGSEDREYDRVTRLIREREKVQFQSQMNSAAISPVNEVSNIIILFTLVLLGRTIFAGQISSLAAILLTYLVILQRFLPLIGQLNGIRNTYARSSAAVEVVYDLIRRDNKPFMGSGSAIFPGLKQEIRLENVCFSYPGHSDLILNTINLTVPKGTTLALVGSSGAGKSTLADLIPRFYDITAGTILIDGVDLRQFDLRSLRQHMGIVSQDTFLFNDTVRANIAYTRMGATDEEIILAAKRANAYEFIERLPEGLDTRIGDRGVMLSGGQRQRLAIARALLQNPEILILDEATSALDTVSERLVQAAIDELSHQRTSIVIAHRLSTIQKADQIAVMDRGQVVELGNHQDLLAKNGHYTQLYRMQFKEVTTSASQADVRQDVESSFAKTSYEVRTRLSSMLGSLGLIVDGLVDTPEEQLELVEEAYESASDLLKQLELLETTSKISADLRSESAPNHHEAKLDTGVIAAMDDEL